MGIRITTSRGNMVRNLDGRYSIRNYLVSLNTATQSASEWRDIPYCAGCGRESPTVGNGRGCTDIGRRSKWRPAPAKGMSESIEPQRAAPLSFFRPPQHANGRRPLRCARCAVTAQMATMQSMAPITPTVARTATVLNLLRGALYMLSSCASIHAVAVGTFV